MRVDVQQAGNHSMSTFLHRYWIIPLSLLLGVYAGLPFLAPVLMHAGLDGAAKVIYLIYSLLCHQLPERSFFLFGNHFTYSLSSIQVAWQQTNNPAVLRQFIGSSLMGWKVAWSDRMVSMFTSLWVFGLIWWPIRHKLKRIPWWGLILFLLPMAIDGTSHFISDLAGIGQGFRDGNLWLAVITQHIFPTSFYSGETFGTFNSLIRLLTGMLFGMGIVWYTYPYLDHVISSSDLPSAHRLTSDSAGMPEKYSV
jgi:uncharacterized membrane protein